MRNVTPIMLMSSEWLYFERDSPGVQVCLYGAEIDLRRARSKGVETNFDVLMFSCISIPNELSCLFAGEHGTGQNVFSFEIHDGKINN